MNGGVLLMLMGLLLMVPARGDTAMTSIPKTIDATINGLTFTIDAQSGSILKLSYPGRAGRGILRMGFAVVTAAGSGRHTAGAVA